MNSTQLLKRFGKRVRELREARGWSQEELAERSDMHRTYIGMIERAEKNITLMNINKIAQAFSISIPELLTFDGTK